MVLIQLYVWSLGKVVENIEDEDEDALISHTHFGIPNYIIDNTDFDPL